MAFHKGRLLSLMGRAMIRTSLVLWLAQCGGLSYGQAEKQRPESQIGQRVKPDPGCANISNSVKVHRSLIDPKTVSDAFGRRIAKRYVVIQVTVDNRSKDFEFLIHDLSLDVARMLSKHELETLKERKNLFLKEQLEVKQKRISALNETRDLSEDQQKSLKKLREDVQSIEEEMASPPTYELSSEELSVVRGVAEIGQALDPRNIILRVLRGAGTVAGGITGVTSFGRSYAPSVAAFNGPVVSAYAGVFPDFTINELNRLNDSAYVANALVPKGQSKVIAVFMPQAIFMNSGLRKKFWKDPTSVNGEVDFRLIEVIARGCFIAEVQQKQLSVLAAVIEPDEMGKFQNDQPQVKGHIQGQSLSGATVILKNTEPSGLSIAVGEGSADERLNFLVKSDKPVAPGTVLQIEVANKGNSQVSSVAIGYQAVASTLISLSTSSGAQGSNIKVTLTGTHFLPGPTQLLISGEGINVTSLDVKSSTSIEATFEISGTAQPGDRDVRVCASGGPSKAVKFAITKPPARSK